MTVVVSHLDNERQRRRDSFGLGYIPPAQPVVDPSVQLHTSVESPTRTCASSDDCRVGVV
jgi:hypothetical protein